MKKSLVIPTIVVLIFGVILLVSFSLSRNVPQEPSGVGAPAPSFELENIDGGKTSLSDYKGQVVVLNFFTTWCPPCIEETADLEAYEQEYGEESPLLIISRDESVETVRAFREAYQTTSPYLLDSDNAISQLYGVTGQPETFIIDQEGVIREHHIGPISSEELATMVQAYQ